MATPGGQISAADIRNEFGPSSESGEKVQLGSYRISQTVGALSNLPLDDGIPQSGQISFNDFKNRKLNVIVNYYSGGNETKPQDAKSRYNANNTTTIGGFRGRPSESAGHKIRIHVNKTISGGGGANDCALRTGNWDSETDLFIDVGSSGKIYGKGGNGGAGGDHSGPGGDGQNGTHALGIQYGTVSEETTVNVMSGGVISCGFGGGGGGSGDHQDDKGEERHANGGGGGGGAGSPAGSGGDQGEGGAGGQDGSNGSHDHGGDGGNGGNNDNQAYGGTGGNGGGAGGGPGDGQNRDSDGGEAGSNGAAIRGSEGINADDVHVINNGTIRGGYVWNSEVS